MIVEIVSTGEEVLSGQIVDTNAAWISAELSDQGIEVARRFTVGDRADDLIECFRERSLKADIVLVTGGLGPTSDDMSSRVMAEAMGVQWRFFPEWWKELEQRYAKHNRPLDPQNKQQATLPDTAEILDNPIGTACGFKVRFNKATFFFMPGVPSEMKRMFSNLVMPQLLGLRGNAPRAELLVFQTFGWAESALGRMLSSIALPASIRLGYRTKMPVVEIKMICAGATNKEKDDVAKQIRERVGDRLFSESNQTLAAKVQELLLERKKTLATAESCTGGLLSSYIVDNPGSSACFDRGFVCYSNASKAELLQIAPSLIDENGAVSTEVATAMAQQARALAKTDFALSITGIAGPDGGTPQKPVGTVVFALATLENTYAQTLILPPWGRQRIREVSAFIALDMLRRQLLGLDVYASSDLVRRV